MSDEYKIHKAPKKGPPRMDLRKYYKDDKEDTEVEFDIDLSLSEKNASYVGMKISNVLKSIKFIVKRKDGKL